MAQCMVDSGGNQGMQVIRIGDDVYRIAVKNEVVQALTSNGGHKGVHTSSNRRKAAMRVPSHRKSYGVIEEAEPPTSCEAEFREATSYTDMDYNNGAGGESEEDDEEEESELMRQLDHARAAKSYVPGTVQTSSTLRSLPYTDSIQNASTTTAASSYEDHLDPDHIPEVVTMKRQYRLYKNREAAKECRRKKKDYVHCLENRVVVLENQNKTLIAELKTLKELYCQNE